MLKSYSSPLAVIFHGCKTQLTRKNVISFSRKCVHTQCIATQAAGQWQEENFPSRLFHREFKTTNLFIPNRGFKLPVGLQMENGKKNYSEKILLGYSVEQLFNIVSDVEHYKDFIPYCTSSVVTSQKTPHHLTADLSFRFPPFGAESCACSFTLASPTFVKSVSVDGGLFKDMVTIWKFSPGLNGNPNTCTLDFYLSYEFRSLLHTQISQMFSHLVIREMVSAYKAEAKKRYGAALPIKARDI